MATPEFQLQNAQINIRRNSPGSVRVLTKDKTGAAVNVSAGYDVFGIGTQPTNGANAVGAQGSIAGNMSFAFDATGITASWTGAQATTMALALPSVSNSGLMEISNDSDVTRSALAFVTVVVDQVAALIG